MLMKTALFQGYFNQEIVSGHLSKQIEVLASALFMSQRQWVERYHVFILYTQTTAVEEWDKISSAAVNFF